jgi:protein-L-isoaspartate O-methyltransferase
VTTTEHDGGWSALGRSLLDSKALSSDWVPTFAAVPRSAFLPDAMWPHDMATGRSVAVSRLDDPADWQRYADANVPVVTQWDDGKHYGLAPGELSTSSASMPSVVFSMLRDLNVRAGCRVLEIGTGTGWNAALLAHRLGLSNVVSIEVDPAVADSARESLQRFRLPVEVITGDGFRGHPDGAPYDRIIATCGLRSLPFAWVEQLHPGGLVLAPWGTNSGHLDATVRLEVSENGHSASGAFLGPVEFMKLRAQRMVWPQHEKYVPAEGTGDAVKSSTTIGEDDFGTGKFAASHFAVGLQVQDCVRSVADKRDGTRPVWFYGLTDRSWAVVIFRDAEAKATVYQSGQRRLWDETEAAWRWWDGEGRPGFERFGLTVTAEGQTAWLDSPENPLPALP